MDHIRPGFYPLKSRKISPVIIPAIVFLGDLLLENCDADSQENNIEFVLVKPHCGQSEWQDALCISEQDYARALEQLDIPANSQNSDDSLDKINKILAVLETRGYLPLGQIQANARTQRLH